MSAKARMEGLREHFYHYGFSDREINKMIEDSGREVHITMPIVSPFQGRIIERRIAIGELVDTSTKLFRIIDLSTVWGWANVYERDIGKVKIGQTAYITVTPYLDIIFTGKITYISDTIDPTTRIVKVRVDLENPPTPPFTKGGQGGLLKPEMFATVKINVGQALSLAVPESTVQREGENTIVFVARDSNNPLNPPLLRGTLTFEKRVVSVGTEVDGYHQVISGLTEGERIVTKGAFTLKSESLKGLMEEE
jgi:RND family efflux transporter MFP subunit